MALTAPVTEMTILCMTCDRGPETVVKRLAWNIDGPRMVHGDIELLWLTCPACGVRWQCGTAKPTLLAALARKTAPAPSRPCPSRAEVIQRLGILYPREPSWLPEDETGREED